ncbi:MAG: Gfo/Idh/MocA family oxidoreductase [Candidatus Omnitrophica bacterium]|nr:Gfo/Idh/MocA family oxidoreductase [Candidatus Omnitrophota bacterium]
MIRIGVIGCGHWGPNHIRIFSQLPNAETAMCSDLSDERLSTMKRLYPNIKTTKDYKEIFSSNDIDAVCIASPTNTHFTIAKEALESYKHVLCEKPLTLKPEECLILKDLALKNKRVLMVGHIFLFNPGIIWMKKYIESGELGNIYSAYAIRTNLGPFRYDVNAMWDLAPHDISIFNYLFSSYPTNVSARGQRCLGNSLEDVAFATLEYPKNLLANIHVSWLDPKKVRQITIVGDKKMVVWDDLDNVGPIKVYDKYVEKTSTFYETYGEFQLLSREGSITIPKIGLGEPLKAQAQYFVNCIEKEEPPVLADAQKGYEVVKTLCAIQQSIQANGTCVRL